jgi:hypothetical protein
MAVHLLSMDDVNQPVLLLFKCTGNTLLLQHAMPLPDLTPTEEHSPDRSSDLRQGTAASAPAAGIGIPLFPLSSRHVRAGSCPGGPSGSGHPARLVLDRFRERSCCWWPPCCCSKAGGKAPRGLQLRSRRVTPSSA